MSTTTDLATIQREINDLRAMVNMLADTLIEAREYIAHDLTSRDVLVRHAAALTGVDISQALAAAGRV